MHLFLTGVLPFLAHDHASAAVFLTCRHHNFHSSIIPEFLSNEKRVKSFCEARQQQNQLEENKRKQYKNLFNLFVQTPLMQFSPFLIVSQNDCSDTILKPLLETKYFTRTLQRCSVVSRVPLTADLLQGLSNVRALSQLDVGYCAVKNEHLEIIVNSFPCLETLTIECANLLDSTTAISISSPPPPATMSLRNLTMRSVDPLFVTQFVPHFTNLKKLELGAYTQRRSNELDLVCLSSLPLLTDLYLESYDLREIESLKDLVHLSSLVIHGCRVPDSLSFLTQENSLPLLTTLCIDRCAGPASFESLSYAQNLHVLQIADSLFKNFHNDDLQHLEDMVHLRKLNLSHNNITGDSRSLDALMKNSFQLKELNLGQCDIGNKGAIARALYSTHSRLRVLKLFKCNLVDDDLNGIGALKNTLEELDLSNNRKLTNEALVHCKDLMKLKKLKLSENRSIDDLWPLKDCANLDELDVSLCDRLTSNSFKVFSEDPNSFPNLRTLTLSNCGKLTEKVFEHLSKNNNLVYLLKKLNVRGMSLRMLLLSSATLRNHICQLRGLRKLHGVVSDLTIYRPSYAESRAKEELARRLRNLDEIK